MNRWRLTRWFELTREEQLWVAGILAIFLIGLVARWVQLGRQPGEEAAGPAALAPASQD